MSQNVIGLLPPMVQLNLSQSNREKAVLEAKGSQKNSRHKGAQPATCALEEESEVTAGDCSARLAGRIPSSTCHFPAKLAL